MSVENLVDAIIACINHPKFKDTMRTRMETALYNGTRVEGSGGVVCKSG
jgi:hypothetical protein